MGCARTERAVEQAGTVPSRLISGYSLFEADKVNDQKDLAASALIVRLLETKSDKRKVIDALSNLPPGLVDRTTSYSRYRTKNGGRTS
jgi:hypothetical protein